MYYGFCRNKEVILVKDDPEWEWDSDLEDFDVTKPALTKHVNVKKEVIFHCTLRNMYIHPSSF